MSGLKEIRNRLDSAKSTQQLTNAMKMVSVSKLRKAQLRTVKAREMSFRLMEIYREISREVKDDQTSLMHYGYSDLKSVMVVVIASDKGMCGTFNTQVCKTAEAHIQEKYGHLHPQDIWLVAIGNKASEYFKKKTYRLFSSELVTNPGAASYSEAGKFMQAVVNDFRKGVFQKVEVVFSRPVNAATQEVRVRTVLPVHDILLAGDRVMAEYQSRQGSAAAGKMAMKAKARAANFQYVEILPDRETVIEAMLPKIATLYLYLSLCLSATAEHGARMTAMSKASDNADVLLKALSLRYNKLRQSSITNELLEIVSGANALND